MATVTRRCRSETCKRRFKVSNQSRRAYCEECRPPRVKAGALVDASPASPGASGPGPIEAQALVRLEAAQRVDTIEGQLLLRLAREADSGRATTAQLGTLAEKLLRVADVALEGAKPVERDALDELAERRAARAASA